MQLIQTNKRGTKAKKKHPRNDTGASTVYTSMSHLIYGQVIHEF